MHRQRALGQVYTYAVQVMQEKKALEIFEGSLQNVEPALLEFKDQSRLMKLVQLYFPKEQLETIVQVTFDNMKSFMCTRGMLLQETDTTTLDTRTQLLVTLRELVRDNLFQFIELEETKVPTPQVHITEKVVMSEEGTVQKRVYVFPKELTRGVDASK